MVCLLVSIGSAQAGGFYTDRTHWFQMRVLEGWEAVQQPKTSSAVLIVKDVTSPQVHLALQIRPLSQLPELVTRDQLLEQARAILKAVTLGKSLGPITPITGLALTGLQTEYSDTPGSHTRVTILLDHLRHRAFVWTATAPTELFPRYDVTFDQLISGLVPALPEN